MQPRIEEKEATLEDFCRILNKNQLLDFVSEKIAKYEDESSQVVEAAKKMKKKDLSDLVKKKCQENSLLLEELKKEVREVMYEKLTKKVSYSIFNCLLGRKVVKKQKNITYISKIPGVDDVRKMIEENPVKLRENTGGFLLVKSKEKEVEGRYYYINDEPVLDLERLVYIYYPKVTDINFSFRTSDPIFFAGDARTWIIKNFHSTVSENLQAYLHPVGIYYVTSSTDFILNFFDEVISNNDLLENTEDFSANIDSVELDFKGVARHRNLRKLYTVGEDVLEDPTINGLLTEGARITGLDGRMYYKCLACGYTISSRKNQSYIAVERISRDLNVKQMKDLLEMITKEYLERLPPAAFGR